MGDNITPKPKHYPEKVRDMLLRNEEIPKFIELTNNLEFQNEIIANGEFLDFVAKYKEFWEYVIAISYGATNIPLKPRRLLVDKAEALAKELRESWNNRFTLKKLANDIGFFENDEKKDGKK